MNSRSLGRAQLLLSLTSSPFNTGRRASTIYEDGPSCSSHWRALSSTQADELLLFMKMSPAGHYDELAPTFKTMSRSLYFKQTGSSLLFLLTSCPPNTNERALIDHNEEPFTVLRTDGLLPTILIDELSRHSPLNMYSHALINHIHYQVLTDSL